MKLEAEHVMVIILVLVFIAILFVMLYTLFSEGQSEVSRNTTIRELYKIWS